ncbi:MAG: hypothetical protein ACRCY9_08650 [Phycicoccus sp.]
MSVVDESKEKGCLVAAVVGMVEPLEACRQELRELVLPGQHSLHMKDERDSRKREIADVVARLSGRGITAVIYEASGSSSTYGWRKQPSESSISTGDGTKSTRLPSPTRSPGAGRRAARGATAPGR